VGSIEPANADFDGTAKPLVLLTHLPLYRRDDSACGAARQHEAGHVTYRAPNERLSRHDVVSKRSSEALLSRARPDVVLSAHTHAMCETTHAIAGDAALGTAPMTASEFTVPAFSWRMRPDPSFALLTVTGSRGNATAAVTWCALPNEHTIFAAYATAGAVSAALFLWWVIAKLCKRYRFRAQQAADKTK